MRIAKRSDKKQVADIIAATFESNPGVNWLIGSKGDARKKIRRLADYAFIKALNRDGVYLSSNEKGVAICYAFRTSKFSVIELLFELRFAITSIPLLRLSKVLKREAYRKKQRPASGAYLYFWFLGVLPGGEQAVFELRNGIFEKARIEKLPIYMETAVERNMLIYKRYGFVTYHYWNDPKENIEFWFMKWEPRQN